MRQDGAVRGLDVMLPWASADTARAFLSDLAIQRGVAASTQNQAFNALLFLLREVLAQDVRGLDAVRAKRGPRLPVVLSDSEVKQVLGGITGTVGLMLRLIFGGGLRVTECTRMRVQDLDFNRQPAPLPLSARAGGRSRSRWCRVEA